jgi:hypothetical protein
VAISDCIGSARPAPSTIRLGGNVPKLLRSAFCLFLITMMQLLSPAWVGTSAWTAPDWVQIREPAEAALTLADLGPGFVEVHSEAFAASEVDASSGYHVVFASDTLIASIEQTGVDPREVLLASTDEVDAFLEGAGVLVYTSVGFYPSSLSHDILDGMGPHFRGEDAAYQVGEEDLTVGDRTRLVSASADLNGEPVQGFFAFVLVDSRLAVIVLWGPEDAVKRDEIERLTHIAAARLTNS